MILEARVQMQDAKWVFSPLNSSMEPAMKEEYETRSLTVGPSRKLRFLYTQTLILICLPVLDLVNIYQSFIRGWRYRKKVKKRVLHTSKLSHCKNSTLASVSSMIFNSKPNLHHKKQGVLQRFKITAASDPFCLSSDRGKGRSKTNRRIAHGFCLMKGKTSRPMEDYHVAEFKAMNGHELGLFAIFDGHSGHDVPLFLQSNLFNNILSQSDFWEDPVQAILSAYEDTDNVILTQTAELGHGGSTAVTAMLVDGRLLYIANVGDSRAVICRGGDAIQLSIDHDPFSEQDSIRSKGGFVVTLPGDVPRVNGMLAVARAFGDKNLKSHLRSDPDIQVVKIDKTDEFLILASDGLWKVMENQHAVDCIRRVKDPKAAAKQLTDEALARNSRDDISCIVVRLR